MKQYSFLLESEQDSITYHVRDPKDFSEQNFIDCCNLINQLSKDDSNYSKKIGVNVNFTTYSINDFKKKLNSPKVLFQMFFTAEYKDHIIGLIHYVERQDDYRGDCGRLGAVVINPEFRKMGIGTNLMKLTKEWIKKNRPAVMVFLGVSCNNPGGLALYNKFGFKPVHQTMVCKL